jgi:hypothetical protein
MKLDLRKKNGERYSRKASSCADIDHLHTGLPLENTRYAKGVQNMFFVEAVNIFPRDYVDLAVPFGIKIL